MNNREKAIKGLECLTNEDPYMSTIACAEKKCPYAGIPDCNLAIWHDALELMKKQEPVEPYVSGDGKDFGNASTWWYACGNCNKPIDPNDKYCRYCGRKVKWDDDRQGD